MKKLALVTFLAFAASWLLAEQGRPQPPAFGGPTPEGMPAPPAPRSLLRDRPAPPRTPDPIPTVSWRKGGGPRPKRATPTPAPASAPSTGPGAKAAPSWFPKSEIEEESKARADASGSRVLVGRVSASEDRARRDLRQAVERAVADWLAADIPPSWKVPGPVLDGMVLGSYVQEVARSLDTAIPGPDSAPEAEAGTLTPSAPEIPGLDGLYTLYRAGQKLDFSGSRRAKIVRMYRRDLATHRMTRLGGGLALALVGLAVLSGYIRADEATKGYYTNRLRLASAAGLGVAGAVAYRLLS